MNETIGTVSANIRSVDKSILKNLIHFYGMRSLFVDQFRNAQPNIDCRKRIFMSIKWKCLLK